MEVPVKLSGIEGHITVLLSSSYSDTYKPFHCSACGNIVFSYNEDKVRSIVPSGRPALDRPGKVYQCQGVMRMRGPSAIYDVLYQVMEIAMQIDNIEDMREAIAFIAKNHDDECNVKCKMFYYVS